MARVHLVHWDPEDARVRVTALVALGHDAVHLPGLTGTPLMRALRAASPDAFLIDLSRRPSHGREVALALAASPATRHIPILCAGGDDAATARLRALLPHAVFASYGQMKTAVPRALRAARAPAAAPRRSTDTLYAGRTLTQKLGITAGERVAAVGAPPGFAALLAPLPTGARLTADPAGAQRYVWFVRTRRELQMALGRLAAAVTTEVAWLAWPKKTSGTKTDLDGNVVREAGLAAGLVDFKVCSIDATWSGLAFKRRR